MPGEEPSKAHQAGSGCGGWILAITASLGCVLQTPALQSPCVVDAVRRFTWTTESCGGKGAVRPLS